MPLLRGVLHTAGLYALVLGYGALLPLLLLLPGPAQFAFVRHWTRVNLRWLALSCGIRHVVEGLDQLPPGPAVLLVQHQSAWETFALPALVPRPVTFVLKRELLWLPVFGWGLNLIRPIAIDRSAPRPALRALLRQGRARLRAGVSVVIFPEGTRVAPGQRRRYQVGGAVLAVQAQVPAVPVALDSGHCWPRRGLRRYPGTVHLRFGPAVATAGASAQAVLAQAQDWIEATRPAAAPAGPPDARSPRH